MLVAPLPAGGAGCGLRVRLRQVQRERAALAGRARQLDLAAEQSRQFAADRQPQARAAVLAAGRAVGLLERLEDDLLLLRRDADAGVADAERDHAAAAVERLVVRRPAVDRPGSMSQRDLALVRELERVGEQVLEDLLQPLRIGLDAARQAGRVDVQLEAELLVLGDVAERAVDVVLQIAERRCRRRRR